MHWKKKGVIFRAVGQFEWMLHHAGVPIADKIADNRLRIYFTPRDQQNRSRGAFIEVEADNPGNVLYLHDRPVIDLGALGAFDDAGVTPCSIVNFGEQKFLYYIGWNRSVAVPYRNAIGLAASYDGGISFHRMFDGPILDRSRTEPYFCTSPFCLYDRDTKTWRLWYASGTGWTVVQDQPEPSYQIRYAESGDGIHWVRSEGLCFGARFADESNARPCVVKEGDTYRMWFCFRRADNYRSDTAHSYRIGYAESGDGVTWQRKDEEAGITRSESGWDSAMMEYPFVYDHAGRKYMLYNGNGFGMTGFGYATLEP